MRIFFVCMLLAGCGSTGGPSGSDDMAGGGSGGGGGGSGGDMATTPCGPMGPFGTYTNVSGGQSGVTACGHTFTSFSGATLTITDAGGGMATLTVTGTGTIGDTSNCPAMVVNGCNVTATACPTGASSTISYMLMTYTHQVSGTAQPQIPGPGGGCSFTYNVDGTR